MSKRIFVYIGLDVLVALLIYAYMAIEFWIHAYKKVNLSVSPVILVRPILLIIIGISFALLVLISNAFQVNRKQAILEFIIIGIPAFYLATIVEMSYVVYFILRLNIPLYAPANSWLFTTSVPTAIGSIFFGYELFMLIIRIVRCKRTKNNLSEAE